MASKLRTWFAALGLGAVLMHGCAPTVPESSTLAQAAPLSEACTEHGVPTSKCVACNPALQEKLVAMGDWCEPHGKAESICGACKLGGHAANQCSDSALVCGAAQ